MIQVGDRVRSFDFPRSREYEGERACFVEGVVEAITDPTTHEWFGDCPRYAVRVDRRVFGGAEHTGEEDTGGLVFPPVNGMGTWLGNKLTDGVELV